MNFRHGGSIEWLRSQPCDIISLLPVTNRNEAKARADKQSATLDQQSPSGGGDSDGRACFSFPLSSVCYPAAPRCGGGRTRIWTFRQNHSSSRIRVEPRRRIGRIRERNMKSPVVKRSIVIAGHKTSVSLEDAFWDALKEIAAQRKATLSDLVASIDSTRTQGNLCLLYTSPSPRD